VLRALFWSAAGLLAWTQAGYPLALAAARRLGVPPWSPRAAGRAVGGRPRVSLIVAAYSEQDVIEAKVANALALDWPREALEVIVAVDGAAEPGADATAERARAAGADVVLELPRSGKVPAQDEAVRAAGGELLAFSDANALWAPDALARLVEAFADPAVGYACGQVRFAEAGGTNQEGLYWRYELWLRENESALASITGGNGAIYAVRREAYAHVDSRVSHDLSFPFTLVKRGWRAVYVPGARASEKMVPTIEGEWRRKRRMMAHAWPVILYGGLLDPRGYPARYAAMVLSHRLLRYASPFLHVIALLAVLPLARRGAVYAAAAAVQAAVLAAAAAGGRWPARPALVARYYVLATAALAAGLYDHLRHGTSAGWEPAEGTR
jgi:hypothetical protein